MWLRCSLYSNNCFLPYLRLFFFDLSVTRTPDNSNVFRFPLKVRVIGSRLYITCIIFIVQVSLFWLRHLPFVFLFISCAHDLKRLNLRVKLTFYLMFIARGGGGTPDFKWQRWSNGGKHLNPKKSHGEFRRHKNFQKAETVAEQVWFYWAYAGTITI